MSYTLNPKLSRIEIPLTHTECEVVIGLQKFSGVHSTLVACMLLTQQPKV